MSWIGAPSERARTTDNTIVVAVLGLQVRIILMRHYRATHCVCVCVVTMGGCCVRVLLQKLLPRLTRTAKAIEVRYSFLDAATYVVGGTVNAAKGTADFDAPKRCTYRAVPPMDLRSCPLNTLTHRHTHTEHMSIHRLEYDGIVERLSIRRIYAPSNGSRCSAADRGTATHCRHGHC